MKHSNLLLSIGLGLVLTACGGGGSSSGGGNDQFAGTYSGNHTVTFNAAGSTSTEQIFLTLVVNADGTYRIFDGDGGADSLEGVGTLDGNRFRARGAGTDTVDGISCTINVTYDGRIENDSAIGTDNGSGSCSGAGGTINITFSGDFNLPKTASAKFSRNGSIIKKAASLLQ